MGLQSLSGIITRSGQSEFDNDLTIYSSVEIADAQGWRALVKKVVIAVGVQATIWEGAAGQFYSTRSSPSDVGISANSGASGQLIASSTEQISGVRSRW